MWTETVKTLIKLSLNEKKIYTERGYFMRSNAPSMDVDFHELLPVRRFIYQLINKITCINSTELKHSPQYLIQPHQTRCCPLRPMQKSLHYQRYIARIR